MRPTRARLFKLLISAVFLFFLSPQAGFAERILEFNSDLELLPNGILKVSEEFKIDFENEKRKTQVVRLIQTRYREDGSIHEVKIKLNRVQMDDSNDTHTVARLTGDEFQVHTGKLDDYLSGVHTFKLDYEVYRAVNFFRGQPELLFNVTGNQWTAPVEKVICKVDLPRGINHQEVTAKALIGTPGLRNSEIVGAAGNAYTFQASSLSPGQDLTVSIDLPKGSVVLPSVLQDLVWYLQIGYGLIVLPLATALILTGWWWYSGRGIQISKENEGWKPPEYLTPSEVGTLFDERCDLSDIVSMVVDLAARGYIRINVLPYNGFLYLSDRDYQLTLLKSPRDRELKPHEQSFLALLFGISSSTYISSIRGKFEENIPSIRSQVYQSLVSGGFFTRDPEMDKRNFIAVGAVVITLGLCFLASSTYHLTGICTSIGIMLSGLVIIAGSRAVPVRTTLGTGALKQTYNFRNFLAHSDRARVLDIAKKESDNFSHYLSYAIVLGVADRWASIFKEVIKDYPHWYQVDETLKSRQFSAREFIRELGDGLEIINRAMTEKESRFGAVSQSALNEIKAVKASGRQG